jgi:hypothetical protein
VPASEFTLWEADAAQEWKDNNVLSYEFALLRQTLQAVFSGNTPGIDKCLLSNSITWDKPFDYQTEEEREETVKKQKERARMLLGAN